MEEDGLRIKGQVFKIRTLPELVLMIVRLRYEKGLNEETRNKITLAGQVYGLLDTEGNATSKYFALMIDEVEQLARELTGKTQQARGLCACGCGRTVHGKAITATQACRKRLSRKLAA